MALCGRLVALEGASGVGKSTLARLLRDRWGWGTLAEAFSRLRPVPGLEFGSSEELIAIEETLLEEECRRYREARRRCRRGEDVVADTGFLGPLTYTAGLVALGRAPSSALRAVRRKVQVRFSLGELGWPDGILYLDLAPAELRRRSVRDPVGHPEPLAARHRAVGRFERAFYLRILAPLWPGRVVLVPATASPSVVAWRANTIASGFPRSAPRVETTREIVDLLLTSTRRGATRVARAPATLKKGTRPHVAPRR